VAALEPGIDPALKWKDVQPRNRFWRGDELMQTIFGRPFDEKYWEANNPASICVANADKIRASGLGVYIEAGDLDAFNLHEATEFMHRIMWDYKSLTSIIWCAEPITLGEQSGRGRLKRLGFDARLVSSAARSGSRGDSKAVRAFEAAAEKKP
jgi:hypothetical protein